MCTLWHSRALFPDWCPWVYEKPIFSSWGKAAAAPCCFLSVLPLQRACKAGNASTSHITGWKEQPHLLVTKCCKTFLGLFLQVQHSGKHWSCFSLCDKGPQALNFRGCPANPAVLVICHCCWNQSEPCLLPGNLQAMEKKNPSSLGTFSPQQTTAFPLSALHPLCQIYRSCIREMGMMGLL